MKKYSYEKVAAAFKYVADCERNGKPISFARIEGLSGNGKQAFKEAITHSFTSAKHGVDLEKVFEYDPKTRLLKRKETPNNPKDGRLILRIISAMTCVGKQKSERRMQAMQAKYSKAPSPFAEKSDEELLALQVSVEKEIEARRAPIKENYNKLSEVIIKVIEAHHLYGIPALEGWLNSISNTVKEFKAMREQYPWLPE